MRIATPYKHPISGIYYFRRAVPNELRAKLNKTMIKSSLGTRSPNEAKRLFAVKQAECENLFDTIRERFSTQCNTTSLNAIDGLKEKTTVYGSTDDTTLQELFNKFNQERGLSVKTLDESQKVLNRFNSVYGSIAAQDINGIMIRKFKELLIGTPSVLPNSFRSMSLLKISKVVGAQYSGKTLSDSSINKHLSVLSSVLEWASNNSYFGDNWHNPVRGKSIHRKGLKQDRMPFTESNLSRIFSSDVYVKHSRPKGGCGEASYWIPIIGLYTGMRLEEIGQLLVADVKREGDIWYFDINDFDGKQLKNKSSIRRVPIHQILLDLGLVDYIGSLADERLFPLLKKDKYGKLTQNWSKWFGRYIRRIGITDRSKVFHSFRHGLKDALRNASVDEAISDAITGHSSASIGRSYGAGYNLTILNDAVQRVDYCIDSSSLK